MENHSVIEKTSKKRLFDIDTSKLPLNPFHRIEILRSLGPYGRMLGLEPGIPKAPDSEFLVRLLTGHASHQASIRHEAGSQYKNLENLIRGRHKLSATTKQVLAITLGLSMENLETLEGSAPDGPLIPEILVLLQIIEALPMSITSGLLKTDVPCPCCGANVLDDVDVWWKKHASGMGQAEYHFAERLLQALLGAGLIERFVASLQKRTDLSLDRLEDLVNPSRHPVGNWLSEAQDAIPCDSLAGLATAMQLRGGVGNTFSHSRLKKWSSGLDVMPLEAGQAIANACGQAKSGMRRLIAARTIALVTDFVTASLPYGTGAGDRKTGQSVVQARLEQLIDNLQIAAATEKKK